MWNTGDDLYLSQTTILFKFIHLYCLNTWNYCNGAVIQAIVDEASQKCDNRPTTASQSETFNFPDSEKQQVW